MLINLIFPLFMILSGLMIFCSNRKHLLLMLLSLELVVLSLYYFLFIYLSFHQFEYYFGMIFLAMSVCEGTLGLSILVSVVRSHGNDYFQTFSILW